MIVSNIIKRNSAYNCLDFAGVHGHLYGHRLSSPGVDVRSFSLVDDTDSDRVVERYLLVCTRIQNTFNHQPVNRSINQSINQSIDRSINQSINQSIDQSIDRLIDQSINQSIDQSINQSIDQSITNQSVNQSINQSIVATVSEPAMYCSIGQFNPSSNPLAMTFVRGHTRLCPQNFARLLASTFYYPRGMCFCLPYMCVSVCLYVCNMITSEICGLFGL